MKPTGGLVRELTLPSGLSDRRQCQLLATNQRRLLLRLVAGVVGEDLLKLTGLDRWLRRTSDYPNKCDLLVSRDADPVCRANIGFLHPLLGLKGTQDLAGSIPACGCCVRRFAQGTGKDTDLVVGNHRAGRASQTPDRDGRCDWAPHPLCCPYP